MTSQGGYYQRGRVDPMEAAALRRENRKRSRREGRLAQRKKRVEAQAQWSAERRALREARESKKTKTHATPQEKERATGTVPSGGRPSVERSRSTRRNRPGTPPNLPLSAIGTETKKASKQKDPDASALLSTNVTRRTRHSPRSSSSSSASPSLKAQRDSGMPQLRDNPATPTRKSTRPAVLPAQSPLTETTTVSSRTLDALTFYRRRERVGSAAPPCLQHLVHRSVNQLTIRNVVAISSAIAEVFRVGGIPKGDGEEPVGRKVVGKHGKETRHGPPPAREAEDDQDALSRLPSASSSSSSQEGMISVSRDAVVSCVLDAVHHWAELDSTGGGSGIPTVTACLPFAGLLRGLQLLGGEMVSGQLIEYLCLALHSHVQDGEESTANALVMLLALLYRLYGVDVVLLSSLLQYFVSTAEKEVARLLLDETETASSDAAGLSASSSPPPALPPHVLCSASCGATLLQTCGEKLWKEKPTLVDAMVRRTKQLAERLTPFYPSTASTSHCPPRPTTPHAKGGDGTNTPNPVASPPHANPMIAGSARFVALVQVMRESSHGKHTPSKRGSKKRFVDAAADTDAERVEQMLQDLKQLLPSYSRLLLSKSEGSAKQLSSRQGKERGGGGGGGGDLGSTQDDASLPGGASAKSSSVVSSLTPHQDRLLTRVIQTTHRLEGISFEHLLLPEKPPRWWVPGVLADAIQETPDTEGDEEEEKEEEEDEEEDEEEEEREREKKSSKLQQIKEMRAQEKAIAGQRFHTENTREIFRCFTSATDDLDAFSMLLRRDPQYQHFPDVCKVALQCCVQEKHVNPFYGSVLERFCHSRRACRVVLQFVLWDYFKSVRLSSVPDMCGFLNIASTIATWMENGVFDLTVLRGLDLEETNKMIGLLARVILLRILLFLSPKQLLTIFFGGDGSVALDFKTDTTVLRASLNTLLERYFEEEDHPKRPTTTPRPTRVGKQSRRPLPSPQEEEAEEEERKQPPTHAPVSSNTKWLVELYDVVAAGTAFDIYAAPSSSTLLLPTSLAEGTATSDGDGKPPLSLENSLAAFQKRVKIARKALNQGLL